MSLAATNQFNVVLAHSQRMVNNASCWLSTVLSYDLQGNEKRVAPETVL